MQGVSAIVLAGASGEAMAWGPGHMAGTPRPGARGMAMIAAHRDTHFAFLEDVTPGDPITVANADGTAHHFTVTGTKARVWRILRTRHFTKNMKIQARQISKPTITRSFLNPKSLDLMFKAPFN